MSTTGTEPATRAVSTGTPTASSPKQRLGSSRDMAGRKRDYETIYILRPDSTTDVIAQVNQKIRGVIENGRRQPAEGRQLGQAQARLRGEEAAQRDLPLLLLPGHGRPRRRGGAQPAPHRLGHPLLLGEDRRERRPGRAHARSSPRRRSPRPRRPGPDEEEIATGQAQARSPFDEEEGAFDFEEAVFGSVDEPKRRERKD